MSAETAIAAGVGVSSIRDLRTVRVMRYALGSSLAMALALGVAWPLSFLTPVLTLSFLATPGPRPTLKAGIGFVAMIAVACVAGLWLSRFFLSYPIVHILITGLVLFRLFVAKEGGAPPLLITFLVITVLLIPFMAMQSPMIASVVALGLVVGAAATIGVVWLTYGFLPDPIDANASRRTPAAAPIASAEETFQNAALSTLVVMPLVVLFYIFQWSSALLILIFVALLSMQPAIAKNLKAGAALIIGNAIGGLAAILIYELLVMVPRFGFLVLLTLLGSLVFGARVFSQKPSAALYKMAFSTTLLVIGTTTGSEGDAGAKAYTRVVQLMIVVVYVVAAFGVLERFRPRREG